MKITSNLGLNPDTMPVSRKPNYGCGGAMGPAQFLPSTWLRYADEVAQLTGHNPPNPWNPQDAFQASAVFLAKAGAASQTTAGEIAAAKTYLSGNPSCTKSICKHYSNRIIALAKEIGQTL
jgi:membrane-bound lytic murein transglycosylase B